MLPKSRQPRQPISDKLVSRQITRFSGFNFQWLSFPNDLEDRFELDTEVNRCARLWIEGLIGILLYELLLFVDYYDAPGRFLTTLIVRLGVIAPLALIVNVSMLYRPRPWYREGSIAVVASVAGMTNLFLVSMRHAVSSAYSQMELLAVILFTNVVLRLRFPYALASSAAMMFGDLLYLELDPYLEREQKVLSFGLSLGIVVITLISNYSFSREERLTYLHSLRSEILNDDLNRTNAALHRLSESDALTGLPNRHAFDRQLATLWQQAIAENQALSVIVIDVDHFKRVNDRYGHLYGDEVLKRIASLLLQALRVKGDFAARFGGEEFVILLPSTPQAAAVQVAERLRKLVEVAGFPPLDRSNVPPSVGATVCCGVATAYPGVRDGSHDLLRAADDALYEAKQRGRNRVCCASPHSGAGEASLSLV